MIQLATRNLRHGRARLALSIGGVALALTLIFALDAIFTKAASWPGVTVEFAPEPFAGGAMVHAMVYEPGGTRLEFACPAG